MSDPIPQEAIWDARHRVNAEFHIIGLQQFDSWCARIDACQTPAELRALMGEWEAWLGALMSERGLASPLPRERE